MISFVENANTIATGPIVGDKNERLVDEYVERAKFDLLVDGILAKLVAGRVKRLCGDGLAVRGQRLVAYGYCQIVAQLFVVIVNGDELIGRVANVQSIRI